MDLVQHRINTGDANPVQEDYYLQDKWKLVVSWKNAANRNYWRIKQFLFIPSCVRNQENGSTRFCVDYRRLNDITKKDIYSLPRRDNKLNVLAVSKWFSILEIWNTAIGKYLSIRKLKKILHSIVFISSRLSYLDSNGFSTESTWYTLRM